MALSNQAMSKLLCTVKVVTRGSAYNKIYKAQKSLKVMPKQRHELVKSLVITEASPWESASQNSSSWDWIDLLLT